MGLFGRRRLISRANFTNRDRTVLRLETVDQVRFRSFSLPHGYAIGGGKPTR